MLIKPSLPYTSLGCIGPDTAFPPLPTEENLLFRSNAAFPLLSAEENLRFRSDAKSLPLRRGKLGIAALPPIQSAVRLLLQFFTCLGRFFIGSTLKH